MGFSVDNPSRLLQPWRSLTEFSEQLYAMMQEQQSEAQGSTPFSFQATEALPSTQAQSELGPGGPQYTPPPRRPSIASGSAPSVAQARRADAATQAAAVASQVTVPRPMAQPAASFGTSHESTLSLPSFSSPTFTSAELASTQRTPPPFVQAAEALGAKTPYSIAPPTAYLPAGINFLDPNNLSPVRQFNPPPVGFVNGGLLAPASCYISPATGFTSAELLPPAVCKRPPTPPMIVSEFNPILTDPWEMLESPWKGAPPEKNDGFTPSIGGVGADPQLVGIVPIDIGPGTPSPDGWLMGNVDLYDNGPPGKANGDKKSSTVSVVFEGVLSTDVIPANTWIFNIQQYDIADQFGANQTVYYAGIPVWMP